MEEENVFDQFDTVEPTGAAEVEEANPFDQFDATTVNPEDQVDDTGVPGQSQVATEVQIAEGELPNDERPLDEVLTTGMYRSGDPNKLYQRFKESPESTITKEYGFFGDDVVSYKGREIPEPEMEPQVVYENGKISVKYKPSTEISTTHKVAETAGVDVPRNIAMTVSSIVDQAFDSDFTQTLDDNLPKSLKAEGEGDELLKVGTQIGVGTVLGGALGGNIQRAAGSISKGIGSILGSVAAMDPNAEALIFGPSGLGYQVKEGDKLSDKVLTNKLNLLMEAAFLAKPVELAGNAAAFAGNVVKRVVYDPLKPILPGFLGGGQAAKEAVVAQEIIQKLNATTPENIDELINLIRKNKTFTQPISDEIGNVSFDRTTMSALAEGASNEAAMTGDDMLKQRMNELAVRSMELEQGAVERGLPATTVQRDKPLVALEGMQNKAVDVKGGIPSIEESRRQLAQEGIDTIDEAQGATVGAQAELDALEEEVKQSLREDPQFGELLSQMEKEVNFDIYSTKRDASEKVMNNIAKGVKQINDTVRAKYDAIPEDVAADIESIEPILVQNDEIFQRNIPKALQILTEVDEANPILDFKTLHNKVLPQVSGAIARLRNQNNPDWAAIDALTELRENITITQLNKLENSEDKAVADAAREAREYYKNTVRFRDPKTPMGQIFDAYDEAYNGSLRNVPEAEKDFFKTTVQQASEGISEKRIGFGNQIMDFYGRPEVGGDPKDIVQVYLGDVAADMTRKLSTEGGISKINPDDIINNLGPTVAGQIKKNDPEGYAQINTFVNRLRQAQGNVEAQKKILQETQKASTQAEQNVYSKVLGNFLDSKMGETPMGKGNGYQIMRGIFRKEGGENQVKELMEMAKDNPTVTKGIQSAYYSYLREFVQNSTTGLNPKEAAKLSKDINSLGAYGDIVFGADSKELQGYKAVVQAVLNEREKRGVKSIAAFPKNAVREGATSAVNTAVTFYFGVLNRMGAMMNRAGSTAIRKFDPEVAMTNLIDEFHKNPDEAARMLEDLSFNMKKGVPSDIKRAMWTTAVRTGVFDPGDENMFIKILDQVKDFTGTNDPLDEDMQNLR